MLKYFSLITNTYHLKSILFLIIMFKRLLFLVLIIITSTALAQTGFTGKLTSGGAPLPYASVKVLKQAYGASTDSNGVYTITGISPGTHAVRASAIGHLPLLKTITIAENTVAEIDFELKPDDNAINEVVVTGTLKEVSRLESPVSVEVYSPAFFKKNPTPSVFDALQNINGVRPQLNCNVCNTGDIHINGLEGPYTMVLIDGMPVVSGLSTVYGLSGIPSSLIERVEIVKGPASSLYGSEAVGGLVNIITKKPQQAPAFSADVFATSWQEYTTDVGFKLDAGKKASVLTGINHFKYGNRTDNNGDNFTDVTQQHRVSVFQKWNISRTENRLFTFAGRYNYEDRWGGDVSWSPAYRGGTERYGESIYTKRWEFLSAYQLPLKEKMMLSVSYNDHDQNSVYGSTPYIARQRIAFGQLTWDKKLKNHDLLAGTALRYTFYDDNTPATSTASGTGNNPDNTWLPGIFIQDEVSLHKDHKLLAGMRYDYNSEHGNILTPRLAYKWTLDEKNSIRLNAGTGFRVVNLFTEDHAATTGARQVVISEELNPERSYNANLNYVRKMYTPGSGIITLDASAWYTRFDNQIIPDYETDPNQIIYRNLQGYAVSRGLSANLDVFLPSGLKILAGASLLDIFSVNNNQAQQAVKRAPLLTEKWTGTWAISYKFKKINMGVDYTGNIYGPMLLPRLSSSDPRSERSPVWSLQNIQLTYPVNNRYELFGGVKNLLNWTPGRNDPFLIARSNDPFDKRVQFDATGQVLATAENPYALTFDPNFVYAPNQGIRGFLGVRMMIK